MSAQFPPAGLKEDSKYFSIVKEDKAIKSESDGGYVYSRPRHARMPRRTFSTGFTNLSQAQWLALSRFIDTKGCFAIFTYKAPNTGEMIDVRFAAIPTEKYTGIGGIHKYDVTDIKLAEV